MTKPSLQLSRAHARLFTEFVQKYSSSIHSLTTLLTESSVDAEKITIHIFSNLHQSCQESEFKPERLPIQAYQCCIRESSAFLASHTTASNKLLCLEDKILCALWYGLKLPLPEISSILQKTVPEIKAQLRAVREKTIGEINAVSYSYDSPA